MPCAEGPSFYSASREALSFHSAKLEGPSFHSAIYTYTCIWTWMYLYMSVHVEGIRRHRLLQLDLFSVGGDYHRNPRL